MIGPFSSWAELGDFEPIKAAPESVWIPPPELVRASMAEAFTDGGLVRQPAELLGRYLVIEGPNHSMLKLGRSKLYSLAARDEVLDALRAHIAKIAELHGPGRVWFLGEPARLLDFDAVSAAIVPGVLGPMFVQATYYGHEKQLVPT